MSERGKFVVIEGTDGSGKGTQIKPITEHLQATGQPFEVIDFPRYSDNMWGQTVGRYLKGEFGGLNEVHPCLAALPYLLDRVLATPVINSWLDQGKLVIANRYAPSNTAFQAAKLPEDQRQSYIEWLEQAEYDVHHIPREDLVVLLKVTPDIGQQNVDKKGEREYLGEAKRDIHERDGSYQLEVAKNYLYLARQNPHWRIIECIDGEMMRSEQDIHQEVMQVLSREGIING